MFVCRRRPSDITRRRAFTIVEMLIVVVILVLLATMMVPRLLSNDIRVYRATCEEVADMLTMFAQRDALTQQPVGVFYDEAAHRLEVRVYDQDIEQHDRVAEWRPDRFIRPVALPEFVELVDVLEDHRPVDIRRWPVASRPGQQRSMIEIVLGGPQGATTSISLAPHDASPMLFSHDKEPPVMATPIDLNAAGRMREDW